MKKLWDNLGIIIYWLCWPVFWLLLPHTERTRLLLICDDKVLVVKGWIGGGKWSLPGGGLHRGENPLQGLLRELTEETGISLQAERVKPLSFGIYRDAGLRFTCHYYVARIETFPQLHRQRIEISTINWVEKGKLNKINSTADVVAALNSLADKTLHSR